MPIAPDTARASRRATADELQIWLASQREPDSGRYTIPLDLEFDGPVDAAALRETGASVLLDGAQGLGAIPVDVGVLGCDYYAASGQKWLCGPLGMTTDGMPACLASITTTPKPSRNETRDGQQ